MRVQSKFRSIRESIFGRIILSMVETVDLIIVSKVLVTRRFNIQLILVANVILVGSNAIVSSRRGLHVREL